MCEETFHIASAIDKMHECVPDHIETKFEYLKKNCFHLAPEIAHQHWYKIYEYVSSTFNDSNIVWHVNLCDTYHNEYQTYLKRFK